MMTAFAELDEGERVTIRFQSVRGGEATRSGTVDREHHKGGLILNADRPQRYRVTDRGNVYRLGDGDPLIGRGAEVGGQAGGHSER